MALKIVVHEFDFPTSGNVSETLPTGSGTPQAAIFMTSSTTADDSSLTHAITSIGFATSSARRSASGATEDNLATSNSYRSMSTTSLRVQAPTGLGVFFEGGNVTFGVDSFTMVGSTNPLVAPRKCAAILFCEDTDTSHIKGAYCGDHDMGTGAGTTNVTLGSGVGRPQLVFSASVGLASPISAGQNGSAHNLMSWGVSIYNGTSWESRAFFHDDPDNLATPDPRNALHDNACVGQYFSSSLSWRAAVTDHTTDVNDGFAYSVNSSSGSDHASYLAIVFEDDYVPDLAFVDEVTMSSSGGDWSPSGAGFEPELGLSVYAAGSAALNASQQSIIAGFTAYTAASQWGIQHHARNNSSNSDSVRHSSNDLVLFDNALNFSTTDAQYSFSQFDSGGATWTNVTTPSSDLSRNWTLFIAANDASGAITGSGTPTEADDTSAGQATTVHVAAGTPSEDADTSAGQATTIHLAAGSPSEDADTMVGAGVSVPATGASVGSGSPLEASDTMDGQGVLVHVAAGTPTEAGDTMDGTGVVVGAPSTITGSGTPTESGDTMSADIFTTALPAAGGGGKSKRKKRVMVDGRTYNVTPAEESSLLRARYAQAKREAAQATPITQAKVKRKVARLKRRVEEDRLKRLRADDELILMVEGW